MASPESRQFFKVVDEETIREGKLGIPLKFARDYGNALSIPVSIKVPSGELWEMELRKCGDIMWLQNGWKMFAEHYHLEYGCILVFNHGENCHFDVLIFGKNYTEIDYAPKTQQQEVKIEELESDELEHITKENSTTTREKPRWKCPRPRKMMRANPTDKTDRALRSESIPAGFKHNNGFSAGKSEMRSTNQPVGPYEKYEALRRASTAFKSTKPFFLVYMQPTYVNFRGTCFLSIPLKFSKNYLNDDCGDVILFDSNGKTWATEYRSLLGVKGQSYVRLYRGWSTFVRDNNLQIGDVCAFELIDCIEMSFKVLIYRGKKEGFRGSQDFTDDFCLAKREAGTSSTHQGCAEPPDDRVNQGPVGLTSRSPKDARERASAPPFFEKAVQPSDLMERHMVIPFSFVEQYFKPNSQTLILKVADRSWPVRIAIYSSHRIAKLTRGWIKFARENCLREGDICRYELDTVSNGLLKVSISRSGHSDL